MEHKAIYELLAQTPGEGALGVNDEESREPWAAVEPGRIAAACSFLRDDERLGFDQLMCLSGIDWDGFDENGKGKSVAILGYTDEGKPEASDRVAEGDLGVAYHLYSHTHKHKFTLRTRLPRTAPNLPTVSDVWPTAGWHEREAWDLLGITFDGHPDPRRILLEEDWVGHPLRKDYQMPGQWENVSLEGRPYNKNPFPPVKTETPEPPEAKNDDSTEPAGDGPAEG